MPLLALLAASPAPDAGPPEPSVSIRALLDRRHPRAPDLDRVGTWLGTDRPLLLRGALKGRVVLLDFWTSGCVNCLHALPVLRALEERFRGKPFQVVGIHSGKFDAEKEVSAVAEAMARHGIEHPVGTDSDMVVWEQYVIHGWPTSVLVDARGYAVAVGLHPGAMLAAAAGVALFVYYKVGLALLRQAWFNLDRVWAAALIAAGGAALLTLLL